MNTLIYILERKWEEPKNFEWFHNFAWVWPWSLLLSWEPFEKELFFWKMLLKVCVCMFFYLLSDFSPEHRDCFCFKQLVKKTEKYIVLRGGLDWLIDFAMLSQELFFFLFTASKSIQGESYRDTRNFSHLRGCPLRRVWPAFWAN